MTLENLGWDLYFQENFKPFAEKGYLPARVVKRNKNFYMIAFDGEIRVASLSGKFLSHADNKDIIPVVGDWVAVEQKAEIYLIQGLLNRKSCFSRKPAISGGRKIRHGIVVGGATIAQAIAANVDIVFIVSTLSETFNQNRIDRYLTMALASRANPVFIFNKADICPNLNHQLSTIEQYIKNYPIHIISVKTGLGMEVFEQYLQKGKSVTFLGSSGVGKSSVINYLFGTLIQKTHEVSIHSKKGQHTTTASELFIHPSGSILIDTPGLKELQLWCDKKTLDDSYEDIIQLTKQCKFNNCSHEKEVDCAIQKAISSGELLLERYQNYKKLHFEVNLLESRKKQKELFESRKTKRGLN